MNSYADTAFLISLHVSDANTQRAVNRMMLQTSPLPIFWLHQIEFRNALRLRVFRKEASLIQSAESLAQFIRDFETGILKSAFPDLSSVTLEAERLSAIHTETIGSRSLDVLHVAAALVLGVSEFLTFDKRQAMLAEAVGLKVPELK